MGRLHSRANDPAHDPHAGTVDDIAAYYHVQSVTKGGAFNDLVFPAAANFPDALAGTPARYFLYVPHRIDRSDLAGSRPFVLKDETTATTLTRVTGSPSTNEYRIPPENSIRRNCIEGHSGQAGHTISYDYYGEGSMFTATEWNQKRWVNNYTITADYTVLDDDYYDRIDIAHSASTKLVVGSMPTLAANQGRRIRWQNTGAGVTRIDGEGSEKISLFGTSLDSVFLYGEDDYVDLVAETTDWKVEHCHIAIRTNWINRADWSDEVGFGSAFSCDTKSAAVDFTGQHFTLASGNAGFVIYDAGGTGSGILYVLWTSSGTNIATNNEAITCGSGGYTALVNEVGGSSKNVDYNICHNLGLSQIYFTKKFLLSEDKTEVLIHDMVGANNNFANSAGYDWKGIDTNFMQINTGVVGLYLAIGGAAIDAEDWYYCVILEINW